MMATLFLVIEYTNCTNISGSRSTVMTHAKSWPAASISMTTPVDTSVFRTIRGMSEKCVSR